MTNKNKKPYVWVWARCWRYSKGLTILDLMFLLMCFSPSFLFLGLIGVTITSIYLGLNVGFT